ncbi:MAG: arsenite methyltransferase [Deltaproteobacteria bacterium]|nr:arsenite methyltransferase [Deltaproteobacteria bacterium]
MESLRDRIKIQVKKSYADMARAAGLGCSAGCCGPSILAGILDTGKKIDYSVDQLALGPGQANLGLGCGSPLSMAGLKKGESVLDLGSGAGFDALLAAKEVGETGRVTGIDMTPEMIEKAERNAIDHKASNVMFRLGEIENLPVESGTIDVVLSNCVINLSPDKESVYGEIFRVLKPGGRIVISDVLRSGDLPREITEDPAAYVG